MTRAPFEIEEVLADRSGEDSLLQVPLKDRVFRGFFALALLATLAVGVQVARLALVKHEFYRTRAEANVTDFTVAPAPRGIVCDRFGTPLVSNEPSWSAVLVPRDLPPDAEGRVAALDLIATRFGEDAATLRARVAAKDWSVSDRLVVSDVLSREALLALETEPIPGLRIERSFARTHRAEGAYAHLVGYVGRVNSEDLARNSSLDPESIIGRAGLEASYDAYLRGADGRTVTYRNARGEEQGAAGYEAPVPGAEVRTFVDAELQEFLADRLARALRELGRTAGAALAMDPRNGEVLALVSLPSFNPGAVARFLRAPGNPLFNRIVQGTYNPGSTIKPLDAVAALAEGVIAPQDKIFSAGFIEVPNPYDPSRPTRFPDNQAHGWVDLRAALARSSNIYFYEVAGGFERQRGVGIEKLKEWWKRFGLGRATGIDLPGEKEGSLPDPVWKEAARGEPWRVGDTYHVAIGQGDLLVTPLGLLNYIAAVANGGTLWKPRVVRAVVEPPESSAAGGRAPACESGGASRAVLTTNEPVAIGNIADLTRGALGEVREGMRDVVRAPYGTARSLGSLPFAVAAKTGTAQVEGNTKLNAFFVGYAPAENPSLALLILVEDAREGSLNTVPVARDVFLWYHDQRVKNAPRTL